MITLGKLPSGLLSLLGIQNFGESPRQLATQISGVVDLRELFMVNEQVNVRQTWANLVNGAQPQPIEVPAGEVWYLHYAAAAVVTPAASTAAFQIYAFIPGTPPLTIGDSVMISATQVNAASQERVAPMAAQPLWLRSGSFIGMQASGLSGGPNPAILNCIVTKLRA